MKLKTLLALPNVNNLNRTLRGPIKAVHFYIEEIIEEGYTHQGC